METPNTVAGRLTECIMARVRGKLPALPTHEFNRVYESVLEELNSNPLPSAVDHYRTALEQIRDLDYRGNRPAYYIIATQALQTRRTLENEQLARLVDECYESMEAYDRTVCTGPILRGGIQPATSEQSRAITQNALATRRTYAEKAEALGFTRRDWEEAFRWKDRHTMSHDESLARTL